MGLFNRRVVPPTIDLDALAAAVAEKVSVATPASLAVAAPLPRTDFGDGFPFGPGVPLLPSSIDPRIPGNGTQPEPRRSEFTTSFNLQLQNTKLVPWSVLRAAADRVDVIRSCIEYRKSQMLALDWDITLTRSAIKQIMLSEGITSPGKASQLAREKFEPEIVRLRQWWEKPDQFNGQGFYAWLGALLEEQLVLDAPALYPRRNLKGDVVAIEVLDGATIKPLLDHRGSTPTPPNPAYQQILYGFPRGEWTASVTGVDDGYLYDQLIYRPRLIRSWTPYGNSPTERALSSADLFLKRMAWIRSEFTDGTTPDTWLELPESAAKSMGPENIRAYEAAINAEMAGIDAERHHLRLLPPGTTAHQMRNFAESYTATIDEFTIKLMCMCFDVMPSEIGFNPNAGLGGKGHQEGEANSAQKKAVRPTAAWLESLLTDISRSYLNMPPELEFKMLGYEIEDQNAQEEVSDSQVRRGGITINEDRASRGMTMFDFPEADSPFIVTGSGVTFLAGAIAAQAAASTAPTSPAAATAPSVDPVSATDPKVGDTPAVGDPIDPGEPVPDGFIAVAGHLRRKQGSGAVAEAAKFLTFARKRITSGVPWRDFEFEHFDTDQARWWNDLGHYGNLDLIKSELADLGKASARIVSRAEKDKLVAKHTPIIGKAVAGLFPSPATMIEDYGDGDDADSFVEDAVDDDYDDLDTVLEEYIKAGHQAAWSAAWMDDDEEPVDGKDGLPARLLDLLDKVPDLRDALVASAVTLVAGALNSRDPDSNLPAVLDPDAVTGDFANVELTATLSGGTLDSAERQQLAYVQLTTSADECEFCQGYDGRVMPLDHDDGMPPLHRGCQCDVEPLD